MEVTEAQLEWTLSHRSSVVIFFHSPLCGTCRLARRMLSITVQSLPGLSVLAADLNVMPDQAHRWEVESVPCLLIVRNGEPVEKMYAFHSVSHLYDRLQYLR